MDNDSSRDVDAILAYYLHENASKNAGIYTSAPPLWLPGVACRKCDYIFIVS